MNPSNVNPSNVEKGSPEDAVINLINIGNSTNTKQPSDSISQSLSPASADVNVNGLQSTNVPDQTLSTSSSSSSSSALTSDKPHNNKNREEKRYRVDIHLCGKNHKFPGHYSLVDKRIIHEWARKWKHNKTTNMTTSDTRTVMCLRKNQQPQRWEQKDVFWWFHTKSTGSQQSMHNSLKRGPFDGQQMIHKQPRYVITRKNKKNWKKNIN